MSVEIPNLILTDNKIEAKYKNKISVLVSYHLTICFLASDSMFALACEQVLHFWV